MVQRLRAVRRTTGRQVAEDMRGVPPCSGPETDGIGDAERLELCASVAFGFILNDRCGRFIIAEFAQLCGRCFRLHFANNGDIGKEFLRHYRGLRLSNLPQG